VTRWPGQRNSLLMCVKRVLDTERPHEASEECCHSHPPHSPTLDISLLFHSCQLFHSGCWVLHLRPRRLYDMSATLLCNIPYARLQSICVNTFFSLSLAVCTGFRSASSSRLSEVRESNGSWLMWSLFTRGDCALRLRLRYFRST
jgi:hypothetical protein